LIWNCWLIDWLIGFHWTHSFTTQLNSTQQRNIEESIEQCEISKNSTLTLQLKMKWNENRIPNLISTLTQLHTFKLIGYRQFPKMNVNLYSITSLHNQIQTCIIERVPYWTINIKKFLLKMKKWIKLEVLMLEKLNIEMIPSEMWMMTKLRHLSLSYNKLSFIPSELYCLSNFTHTHTHTHTFESQFESNHTYISNQMNKLTQLQFLNLSFNELTEISDDISSFHDLSVLWIGNNKLKQFPSQHPPNLVHLIIGEI
jgi:Leucine-rich repeat (LRR) protein